MQDLKYSEILRLNKELGNSLNGPRYRISILSNIITSQLNEIVEYALRSQQINATVESGEYDNIVQDSAKHKDADLVIIFWETANLIDGLQYKAGVLSDGDIDSLTSKVMSEIDMVLDGLRHTPLVIFNRFSSLVFTHDLIKENAFDGICKRLNTYLEQKQRPGLVLVDIDKLFAKLSVAKSVDWRFYYTSKALYSTDFYKAYSAFILPIIKAVKGKAKKALIFDCDNTLWKGIIGEDGMQKVEMSGKNKNGVVFEEIQHLAIELEKKGILLGLCTKNNLQDVEDVLNNHPDMTIRNGQISIKKINWDDKISNLKAISEDLNIGLDSMVFVDDSDFEVGFVQEQLPEVTALQVPKNVYHYPSMIRENQSLFYTLNTSEEDLRRTQMYKQQVQRAGDKKSFDNVEGYLASLGLVISIQVNPFELVSRISQLTQKTNQFNLTTKRYTDAEIQDFTESTNHIVYSLSVADKYGDSGVTGVCIVQKNDSERSVVIDTLLLSCRVLGRNIEFAFFNYLVQQLKEAGTETILASYIKTFKNEQVVNFYDNLGFNCEVSALSSKEYKLELINYTNKELPYIAIK